MLVSTGCRPNEVLSLRWSDVDLLADPPTMTITGTMIDHGAVKGEALHRHDERKGRAPAHTVILPRLAVEALTILFGDAAGPDSPVFANRDGGLMSLASMRRSLRAALPEELGWVTPRGLRPTVATVVRHNRGALRRRLNCLHANWPRPSNTTSNVGPWDRMPGRLSTSSRTESSPSFVVGK
ncbi:hypothetical protein ACFVVM_24645 [Nocardia sp. NPDC058176]|uniref:hypothetical protein n=1 Tax=Nocardia sp. NPDC058176 TaxID=3346368 RepID=UPI0036D88D73